VKSGQPGNTHPGFRKIADGNVVRVMLGLALLVITPQSANRACETTVGDASESTG